MSEKIPVSNVVAVLLDQGPDIHPRWRVGSGFLIGGTQVLTVAHNVAGEGELFIQLKGAEKYAATIVQMGDVNQGFDLAIIKVTDPRFPNAPVANIRFATLNRHYADRLSNCVAIGFPKFKARKLPPPDDGWLRDYGQIEGEIPLASNVKSGMLELHVTATPQASLARGSSEWEGMSGAVVFWRDPNDREYAIGVLVEHYPEEGSSSLMAIPLTAINDKLDEPTAHLWWELLGVPDPHQLPQLPLDPDRELVSAERSYRQQVINKYKSLDFGGFARSDLSMANVPLEEVFVRLSLTVEKIVREPVPSDMSSQAERRERQQRERVITVQEPIELGQALSNNLLVVGEPGAGKSMLLRWLAVTFAQGRQREPNRLGPSADPDRLPVLVELGHLPDRYVKPEGGEMPNWIQFLPEYLPTQPAFTDIPPQLLTGALADGRCLLLFDGLDEVADRQVRARLARSLAELARLSPGNRVIIGSRPAGVSESEGVLRPQFQRCQIERFTSEDIQRFFRFWYALDSDLTPKQQHDEADALFARVQATPAILQLATTPLLSTILVLIWRNEGDLPQRRVDLYERCCHVLIERWEASHDVAFQGVLGGMDWEDHLRLLTPLAYTIHSQEQRTSATREELVPLLTQALQTEGYANEQTAATREAKHFLDALGLRSGLLQYMGDDRYGFPHQTFQEYLAARYIAARPDPDYIDLVMAHLHEAWWQEVHLLTIAHLGSTKQEATKVSALILTILHVYAPPSWILRPSRNRWLHLIEPGKFVPQMQLERRIAWILAREFELVAKGYVECVPDGTTATVGAALSAQAASLVRRIIYDERDPEELKVTDQSIRARIAASLGQVGAGNEAVVNTLVAALHDADQLVRARAAMSLGQVRADNEVVVNALLQTALHDADGLVRWLAKASLGQVGAGNEAVVNAFLQILHDADRDVRWSAITGLRQVGAGNEAVVNALLQTALHDAAVLVRYQATVSLGQVGAGNEAVVNALLQTALHDTDQLVRAGAAVSLGQVGVSNETVVNALLQTALHDTDRDVRRSAITGLGQVGAGNEAVVNALLQALHDAEGGVRRNAAVSLGQVGAGNEAVVNALLQARHDTDWDVRKYAAASLGQVGAGNEAVVNALLQALHDTDRDVREYAAASLGQVGAGNEAVVNALLQTALHGTDRDIRAAAAASLGQVGAGNEAVVNALVEVLHRDVPFVREAAAASLGQLGVSNEAVVNALLQAPIFGPGAFLDPPLVIEAMWEIVAASLGRLEISDTAQLRQVLVALNRCLHTGDSRVCRPALVSIRQLLDGRAIPGYRWVPLRKRRARRLRLKRIAFWLGMTAIIVMIGLVATWLLGALDPNGFPVRFLAVLAGIIAFVAAIAQVVGRTLRDPWEHS